MVAHLLLSKIYPDNHKIVHAAFLMINGRNNVGLKYNNKKYAWLRNKRSEILSKEMTLNNPFRGKMHSMEARKKMSDKANGRTPWNKNKVGVQEIWNKGLTKETSPSLKSLSIDRTGAGNPMFGKCGKDHPAAKSFHLFNSERVIIGSFESSRQFKSYCKEHNMPFNGLYKTLKSNKPYNDGSKNRRFVNYNGFMIVSF